MASTRVERAVKTPVSLKRALTLNFLFVAIMPILVFGAVAVSLLENRLLDELEERNLQQAKDIGDETKNILSEIALDLQLVGKVCSDPGILQPDAVDRYLDQTVRNSGVFESIFILNEDRRIINLGLNQQPLARGKDYRQLDFSAHALFRNSGGIEGMAWSNTFLSLATGKPSISLGISLAEGYLFGNINLKRLSEFLDAFSQGTRTEFAILDRNGAVIAHSNGGLAIQRVNFLDHREVVSALQGETASIREQYQNASYIASAVQVPMTGWVVWVGVDEATVKAPLRNLRNLLLAFMALGVFLAGGGALRSARRLISPLAELGEGVEQIGRGNYDFHHHQSGFQEIDRLAEKIADMTQEIEDRESSILDSERRFRDLVNSIDGIVWERDFASRRFSFVSRKAEDFLGYPVSSWMQDPAFWENLIHPDDREATLSYCRLKSEQQREHDCEYRMIAADGRVLWIRDLIRVLFEGDRPASLLGVMIDETRSKQMDQELRRYRQHLEELIEQRTRELERAQKELLQNERLAVLGQLTATVSHEIRNPLGTISNALYLMRESLPSDQLEQVRRPLALAEKSVQRCDGIISELLDFSKRRQLQKVDLDLDAWLMSVLDEMIWPENVRLDVSLTGNLMLQADPDRLRRALINATTNALHALEEKGESGPLRLEVMTRQQEDCCEILIRDNGPGIPADVIDRIFEPMFSTKNFGVGLGVPVICNIIEDHGGSVLYESEVGVGTTVVMSLPLTRS